MITVHLPVPPSVNAAYRNVRGRGRVKAGAYVRWLRNADARLLAQWHFLRPLIPVAGPCELRMRLPEHTRGDCSNRIKLAEDFLVSRGITGDDKHNRKVAIERDPTVTDCVVEIREATR